MAANKTSVLVINSGSSSIRFAICHAQNGYEKILWGKIDRTGTNKASLVFSRKNKQAEGKVVLAGSKAAAPFLFEWLKKQKEFATIKIVGHRIVHGATDTSPKIISETLLKELKQASKFAPNHLPGELHLINITKKYLPGIPQVACSDSDFHKTLPPVAKLLPIPRRYNDMGIRRYGYHGLSYSYVIDELHRSAGGNASKGRIIVAHLGSGTSLAAVKNGLSIDTTMGFTPTGGVLMGSRSGELDPGVLLYLIQKENLKFAEINKLVNQQSGLLGVSESSADIRDLLKEEANDIRAAEAIELYCYQIKKAIGAYAAVLGGLDVLVFTGGIGQHQPLIRQRICQGLEYLGIKLNEKKNNANKKNISAHSSRVQVRIVNTDEEWMLAKTACSLLP